MSQKLDPAATSFVVDVSAVAGAGRKLFMAISTGQLSTISTPAGWTQLGVTGGTASNNSALFWKDSDGTETTATLALGATVGAVSQTWAIGGAHSAAPEQSVAVLDNAAAGTVTSATVTPSWGLASNLYLALLLTDRDLGPPNVSTYPVGFPVTGEVQNFSADSATDCAIAYAEKTAASSSESPSAWIYGVQRTVAITVAVRPA